MRRRRKHQEIEKEFQERVVQIRRVSKTVAGGKRFRFSALVVVGDGKGRVGVGLATATQTPQAIRKAVARAEKNVFRVPLLDGTIAHEIKSSHGASTVLLLPATQGTGVIAGATVRALCEAAGIKNIRTKIRGSTTPINVLKAMIKGLSLMRDPRRLAALRGLPLEKIWSNPEVPS